jgi:hypothetical protein
VVEPCRSFTGFPDNEMVGYRSERRRAREPRGKLCDVTDEQDLGRSRRRWLRFAVFGAFMGVAAALVLPTVPRDQSVRLHLGAGSTRVTRATARITRDVTGGWDRETTWSFDHGAPPSITWKFELPNGNADVEVELASAVAISSHRAKVDLAGHEATVELTDAMRGLE